jgi:hypothetical protein
MFAFLLTPFAKLAVVVALVLTVVASGYLLLQQHDARVLAEQNLVVQKQITAEQAAQAARTIATLQQENAQALADAASAASTKRSISNAKVTSTCAGSPAIGAALRGLQSAGDGPGAKGKLPGQPVGVSGGATAPVDGH